MGKRVISVGLCGIGKVDIDEIGLAPGRNTRHNPRREVAMRVDKGATTPGLEILVKEGFEESRFSGASLADDMHVGKAVGLLDSEFYSLVAVVRLRKIRVTRILVHSTMLACRQSHVMRGKCARLRTLRRL